MRDFVYRAYKELDHEMRNLIVRASFPDIPTFELRVFKYSDLGQNTRLGTIEWIPQTNVCVLLKWRGKLLETPKTDNLRNEEKAKLESSLPGTNVEIDAEMHKDDSVIFIWLTSRAFTKNRINIPKSPREDDYKEAALSSLQSNYVRHLLYASVLKRLPPEDLHDKINLAYIETQNKQDSSFTNSNDLSPRLYTTFRYFTRYNVTLNVTNRGLKEWYKQTDKLMKKFSPTSTEEPIPTMSQLEIQKE